MNWEGRYSDTKTWNATNANITVSGPGTLSISPDQYEGLMLNSDLGVMCIVSMDYPSTSVHMLGESTDVQMPTGPTIFTVECKVTEEGLVALRNLFGQ